jgi:N-acetylglucosaminyldiphosphoundecaprenol N-acetyl-beta-D-mannosaminyltransferase
MNTNQELRIKNQELRVVTIFDTRIHDVSFEEALGIAKKFIHSSNQHYIVTPNPEIVLHASKDKKYQAFLNNADLILPDGVGIVWASRVLNGYKNSLRERVTGADFMVEFCSRLSNNYGKVFKVLLVGGEKGAGHKAATALQKSFPNVIFYSLGNHKSDDLEFIVNDLIMPDCIFVALGFPKQEFWIRDNLSNLKTVKLAVGVGGAIDFVAGKTPRAPLAMRKVGLEWLWRLLIQPSRIPRIFRATVVFPIRVMLS